MQQAFHTNLLNVQQSDKPLATTFESNAQSVICTQLFAVTLTNKNYQYIWREWQLVLYAMWLLLSSYLF